MRVVMIVVEVVERPLVVTAKVLVAVTSTISAPLPGLVVAAGVLAAGD